MDFFFLVHSGVSFQSVHLMHSVVWVSVMYFSPLFVPFHMNIPRFRILGLISHRKSASKSLFRPSVLDSLTYVPFESFEIRISNVQDFRNFKLQKSRTVCLWFGPFIFLYDFSLLADVIIHI